MAKSWVITIEPTDKSSGPRTVDTLTNRKKIAQVEEYLCELYKQMVTSDTSDLKTAITRKSGFITSFEKAPYILRAELANTEA